MTYAYTGDVLLPITVTPGAGADGSTIKAHAAMAGVPGDLRAGGGRLPAGPAGRDAAAIGAGAAVHGRMTGRCRMPSPWQAVVADDGTLWVKGPELTPATVVDAWFIPDAPGSSETVRRSR